MSSRHRRLGRYGAFLSGALLAVAAGLSPASADEIIVVYIEGTTTEAANDSAATAATLMNEDQREAICADTAAAESRYDDMDKQLRFQLVNTDPELEARYNDYAPSKEEFKAKLDEACEDPETVAQTAQLVYSTCRMTMRDGENMIDVRFPPGTGEGWLTFLDPTTFVATEMPINFTQPLNQQTGLAQGTDSDSITGPGGSRDKEIGYNFGETLTLTGGEYSFDFNFELNVARSIMGAGALAGVATPEVSEADLAQMEQFLSMFGSPTIHSSGSALIAPDAPGLDIIRAFYQTFAAAMGAEGSYLTGLYNHRLIEVGFPLELNQTTEVVMPGGGFAGLGIPGIGAGQQSASTSKVTAIIGPLTTDYVFCADSIVPPEYTVSNTLTNAPGGSAAAGGSGAAGGTPVAGGGAGGEASVYTIDDCDKYTEEALANMTPEERDAILERCPNLALSQGMNALNEAMQNMTPEQQAAMQQFGGSGLGALLGGLTGAANSAGAANAAGAAAAGAAPASAAPAAARPGPSLSSALMTDNLTQSAQNMLQALGYDTGNTDGELGIETTIAISQFQAEKGLEVTGEVTPQLLGILAAEVDAL